MRERMAKRAKKLISCKTVYFIKRDRKTDYCFKGQLCKTDKILKVYRPRIGVWCW